MKIVLFFALAILASVVSLAMWLTHRESNLYPRADFAVMPKEFGRIMENGMSFVYKDREKGYTVNVDNLAFDPTNQLAILGGTVTESSDPSLPTGSQTIIYVQGTEDFWQNFPSPQTSFLNNLTLN